MLGLTSGSYEAYCLDQAVWYLGTQTTHRLEKIGRKKQKGEAAIEAARKRELDKILGVESGASGFADPAALFNSR